VTILDEILAHKRRELAAAKQRVTPGALARAAEACEEPPRGFRAALRSGPPPRIVAEIKRRSPSKGEIRADFDPAAIAKAYAEAGAAALSVLTDERFFGGHLEYLALARRAAGVPLLRKDFLVDAYQVDEARAAGADAILLIVAALPADGLRALHARARALGLDVLVEVHDDAELDVALAAGADLVGINNRDLRTFAVDLGVTERLAARLPAGVVLVAESGIHEGADVERLHSWRVDGVLVGEALVQAEDLPAKLAELVR